MFDVYAMICKKETYVGMSSNLSRRKYLHKARFLQKTTHGSDYYVYRAMRKMTNSFDEIEFKVIKSFANKEEAVLYEEKMIRSIGTLNTQKR